MARTITVQNPGSQAAPQLVVYKKAKRRKKVSRRLRGLERAVDQFADASGTYSSIYQDRHRRSNRKKKDGWLRDLHENVYKSLRKARKKIKLDKIFKF